MANVETEPVPVPVPMPDLADLDAVVEYVAGAYDPEGRYPKIAPDIRRLLRATGMYRIEPYEGPVCQVSKDQVAEIAMVNIERVIRREPPLEYLDR